MASKFIRFFCLLFAAWTVLATSTESETFTGRFNIISDCFNPVIDSLVDVTDGVITQPVGTTFLTFGFPVSVLDTPRDTSGVVNGRNRICSLSYDNGPEKVYVFTCDDDGQYACTITIK